LVLAAGEAYLWTLDQQRGSNAGQVAALQSEITQLQNTAQKPAIAAPESAQDAADLSVKTAALAAQVNAMQTLLATDHGTVSTLAASAAALPAQVNAMQTEVAADHAALATLQADEANLTALAARAATLNEVTQARLALDAGQPLGPLPNAPAALAVFANVPPPTEAALRLAFPAAAQAAEAASASRDGKGGYWARVLARIEGFITISDGGHVIIGAPAAGVLAQAKLALDAGDLAGAVAQIQTLSQPTQQAMGAWLAQAQALLAARAALAVMGAQA